MPKLIRRTSLAVPALLVGALLILSLAPAHTIAFSGGLSISGAEIWTQAHSNLTGISPEKNDQFGGVKNDQGTKLLADTLASGDFDGDGFFDLAIGTPYEDVGGKNDAGMVVVLYSTGSAGIWTNGYQAIDLGDGNLPGNESNNFFGAWMTVGDYDNDGYDDLAISAGQSGLAPAIEELYILPGGSSGLSRNTFQKLTVQSGSGWIGALASGDLNGDGYDDLAVSSVSVDARLYWGSGSGLANGGCPESGAFGCPTTFGDDDLISELGLTDVQVPGVDRSLFGNSLAIGDLDNDGYDDLAIGDPYADAEANCVDVLGIRVDCDEGGVYVIYGSSSLDDSGSDWAVSGEFVHQEGPSSDTNEWHDGWGRSVAIGDFDGDGYGDLAVGAPQEDHGCVQLVIICDNVGKGSVTVIYGDSGGLSSSTKRITQSNLSGFSNEKNDRFGEYLAVGNFNGDGADDLAIGIPEEDINKDNGDTAKESGAVVVLYGTVGDGLKGSEYQGWSQKSFDGASAEGDDQFGRGVVAGDFTGNGGDDLAVAAPGEDLSSGDNDDDGMVVVFYGTGDTTAPSITANISGTQGDNGWYTSDVTLSWTIDEPQSPHTLSKSGCGTVTVASDTAGTNYTCEATSAGGTASKTVTILRDATAPTVDSVDVPAANSNGWYNSSVTVTWHCSDATSGVIDAAPSFTLHAEGTNQGVSGGCRDNAGNYTQDIQGPFSIDLTDPVITNFDFNPANAAGWHNTPVVATWNCTDALSGPTKTSDTQTLDQEGTNQALNPFCRDLAGNSAFFAFIGINIDLTPPIASHDGPYTTYEGTTIQLDGTSSSDALSGVASTAWAVDGDNTFDDGDPASFTPPDGPAVYPMKLHVVDVAGNTTTVTTTVTTANVDPSIDSFSVAPSPSTEGSQVTATIDFSDPGVIDTHTCAINWGDGTAPTSGTIVNRICTASHTYLDDNAPAPPYNVTVSIVDKDGDLDQASIAHTVTNVAPAIDSINVSPSPSNEGEAVTLDIAFTDPGLLDTHTCLIDWGDDNTESVAASAYGICTVLHTYADDNPSNTAFDDYTIAVTVTDKDGDSDQGSIVQTVHNVAPSIDAINVPAAVDHGQIVAISVDASDPGGSGDPLTYEFDCDGDGVFEINAGSSNSYNCFPDQSTLSPLVGVRVSDDDLGVTTSTEELYVQKYYCASFNTGRLREGSQCNGGEMRITLRPDTTTLFCASLTTGELTYSSAPSCATGRYALEVPASIEISVCHSVYSGLLSYRFSGCTSSEIERKIPAA